MKILVTGASGFVGQHLLGRLLSGGDSVRALVRRADVQLATGIEIHRTEWMNSSLACSDAVRGCDAVVHLAARVHVMRDNEDDPLVAFRRVNVDGTLALAAQAAQAGVRRFVFLSSIKVNGEETQIGAPYTADDIASPLDAYGVSKWEAERGLREISARTGLEVAIIRPPLVYGPGVKANFLAMMRWLARGVPLPLGAATENRRSLIAIANLADLIATCVHHPAAASQTFLASDADDLSTAELLRRLSVALGRPARLLPVPTWMLSGCAGVIGRGSVARRLLGSLQVSIEKTMRVLDWRPPMAVDDALQLTAADFLARGRNGD